MKTEHEFTLPKGFVDGDGQLHRHGVMRLATARDEIEPLRDPRVAENEAYLTVLILARVITRLGDLPAVDTETVEGLFAADLAYLQDLYGIINFGDATVLSESVTPTESTETAQVSLAEKFAALSHQDDEPAADDPAPVAAAEPPDEHENLRLDAEPKAPAGARRRHASAVEEVAATASR